MALKLQRLTVTVRAHRSCSKNLVNFFLKTVKALVKTILYILSIHVNYGDYIRESQRRPSMGRFFFLQMDIGNDSFG